METWVGEIARALFDKAPVVLLLLGTVCMFTAAAGGVHDYEQLGNLASKVIVALLGFVLVGAGIVAMFGTDGGVSSEALARHKAKITSPCAGAREDVFVAYGTLNKQLAKNCNLQILRSRIGAPGYVPIAVAEINRDNLEWTAERCDLGSLQKRTECLISACIVGLDCKVLLEYYREAARVHNRSIRPLLEVNKSPEFLTFIPTLTPDMLISDSVRVIRR